MVWLRRSSKALTKTKLAPKKGRGHCLVIWSTTAFWIPAQQLHLRSMLSKSMRGTKNFNACSWHWSTEWDQFFSMTTLNFISHNQHIKSWTNWATKFCFICYTHLASHQLTTTSSSISTIFCRENASTTSKGQKMLSESSLNPKTQTFMLQELANLFLVGKTVLILLVPILIYED